jgi:23S rRNA (uracil1939-C5)-methyltransferase
VRNALNKNDGTDVSETVRLVIERIIPGGYGIAFLGGTTYFVPLSAPQDVVLAVETARKGNTAWAEIVQVIEPGPSRRDPPCEYYGICGGCDLQHIVHGSQADIKTEIVRDCLRRITGIDLPEFVTFIPSPKEFGYRTRVRWHCENGNLGFRERGSHRIVSISGCLVLCDELNEVLHKIRRSGRAVSGSIEASSDGKGNFVSDLPGVGEGRDLAVKAYGETYKFSAECFFQSNLGMLEPLIAAAVEGLNGNSALDIYSGVGLFTIPLARRFREVVSVEADPNSMRHARDNAELAGLTNILAVEDRVERFCQNSDLKSFDTVILDPPRSGPSKELVLKLANSELRNISYVSCEPSILARDLKVLLAFGYEIMEMRILDMFPQTHHVETVVRLSYRR